MYSQMLRIRAFEEAANDLYRGAKMPGLTHLYMGQEGVAVGACEALRQDDFITSTHRGHGHCLAKGANVRRMYAELLGKEDGLLPGQGRVDAHRRLRKRQPRGQRHRRRFGRYRDRRGAERQDAGTDQVVVCFFGEGALGQGLLYEVMNMAALWSLPVIYLCENNQYNEYTHFSETTAGDILARAAAFGIPGEEVDGQDVLAVNEVLRRAVARARAGAGPSFVVANTYRYHGHHVGDVDREYYRSKEEESEWKTNRDPIERLGSGLIAAGLATVDELERVAAAARDEIALGVEYALAAAFPAESEVALHVYA